MNPYPLQLEISGPIALWARPDTMPNPVSYVDAFHRRLKRGRWFYTPCQHHDGNGETREVLLEG